MPDDTITLVSTTDTAEQVQEALTNKPAEKPKPVEPPAAAETETETETAETPAERAAETPTQKESREASEAGGKLAKRKADIQAEINELTRNKHTVRRDVEAEEARLNELRRQRQEFEAAPPAETPPDAKTPPPAEDADEPKLDAVDEQGSAKYATYEDYLSAHAVWTKEQAVLAARKVLDEERQADRERIERESTSRVVNERLATYNDALETFKTTHADFDAVFQEAKDSVQDMLVALGPNALRVIDGYTVFDAEDGPALTYYLLKRPDELKAIAAKPQHQQLVHLARLEERIRGGAPKKTGPPPAAVETKAPEPIRPVGSGPTATTVPLDEEPFRDYVARRERELRARRGL